MAVVVSGFLTYSVPPYFSGDPTRSRVPATFGLHYPLLVAHVLFATVAMITGLLQIWPWLRRHRPVFHRRIGRVYVSTALPAGVCAVVIGAGTPFGPILMISNVAMAPLWLWFTITGYIAARRHQFAEHRRQMIRSVTLTFSVISNRIWGVMLAFMLEPLRGNLFHGNDVAFVWVAAGMTGWLGWTIPLLVVHRWLRREEGRKEGRKEVIAGSSISDLQDIRRV